jgi:hypothetical protein
MRVSATMVHLKKDLGGIHFAPDFLTLCMCSISADAMHDMPGRGGGMSPETFAMMGFMLMPMLFVLYGVMERLNRRRQITQVAPWPISFASTCLEERE